MVVLDTTFAVDVLRGDEAAVRTLSVLQKGTGSIGVTVISHFELFAGAGRARRPAEESSKVGAFLQELTLFETTPESARLAGLLDAKLSAQGRRVGVLDLLIGATALHHGEALVTRKRKDFEAIPDLEVIGY